MKWNEIHFDNKDILLGHIKMQVWKKYVCEDSKNDECVSKGRLSPSLYSAMTMAVNVSYGFYYYSPFLVDLADCDFVRQSFVTISKDHCPGLQSQSKWMYIGLVVVSAAVMSSSIFWIAHGREQKHRYYTKLGLSKTFWLKWRDISEKVSFISAAYTQVINHFLAPVWFLGLYILNIVTLHSQ